MKVKSLYTLTSCVLAIVLFSQHLVAQPTRKDYKNVPSVTFYGVVYNGTRIIKADKTVAEYKTLFEGTNDYYVENPGAIGNLIKREFKILLDGVDVSYANSANDKITELGLYSYSKHQEAGKYTQLQEKLENLRIPHSEGYGLILFSYRIDYKEREQKYDLVFFNRQTMRIVAFGNTESDSADKDAQKLFVNSVQEAVKNYRYQN